jgi:hypothetical protein
MKAKNNLKYLNKSKFLQSLLLLIKFKDLEVKSLIHLKSICKISKKSIKEFSLRRKNKKINRKSKKL